MRGRARSRARPVQPRARACARSRSARSSRCSRRSPTPIRAQRRMAIELLGHLRNEHAAVPLLRAAPSARATAARRRALLGGRCQCAGDSLAPRFAALRARPERRLRDAAAWALARMRGPRALAALRELLASSPPGGARLRAARARPRCAITASRGGAARRRCAAIRNAFVRGAAALGARHRDREPRSARAHSPRCAPSAATPRPPRRVALGLLGERARAEPLAEARVHQRRARCAPPRSGRCAGWRRGAGDGTGGRAPELPEPGEPEERPVAVAATGGVHRAARAMRASTPRCAAFEAELRDGGRGRAARAARLRARAALALLSGRTRAATLRDRARRRPRGCSRRLLPVGGAAGRAPRPQRCARRRSRSLSRADREAPRPRRCVARARRRRPAVQSAALAALAAAGGADQPAAAPAPGARSRSSDPRWWMRRRAVEALAAAPGGDAAAVPLAQRPDRGHYAYVREAAAKALGELRAERLRDELAAAFDAGPRGTRSAGRPCAALRTDRRPHELCAHRTLDRTEPRQACRGYRAIDDFWPVPTTQWSPRPAARPAAKARRLDFESASRVASATRSMRWASCAGLQRLLALRT